VVETRQLNGEDEEQITVSIRAVNVSREVVNGLSQWTPSVRSEGDRFRPREQNHPCKHLTNRMQAYAH
jgi:hypothetical protein